jgi:hypothetical protein
MQARPVLPLFVLAALTALPGPGAAQVTPRCGSVFDGSPAETLAAGVRRDGTILTRSDRESLRAQVDDLGRGVQCYKEAQVALPARN